MSYILEALRKAEQERSLGQVPNLKRSVQASLTPVGRSGRWWLLAFALLINAGMLSIMIPWREFERPAVDRAAASQVISSESAIANTQIPAPRPEVKLDETVRVESPSPVSPGESMPVSRPKFELQMNELPEVKETVPAVATLPKPAALSELPGEFRRSLAELNLDVHVYSKTPGTSFVMINAMRYVEGDRLSEGPLVEAITAKGVVLDYQGYRFLLPVQH